jgi:hypothetical protein
VFEVAVSKERINHLLNHLPEKDLLLVSDLLERLTHLNKYSDIPIDDEPTTQDDLDAIKAAHEDMNNNELIDSKDIEDELRS